MEALASLGHLLKILSTFGPLVADRILAKDGQKTDFFENSADAIGDADKLVDLGKQVQNEDKAADEEYKKRGL